jgi:aspartyl-tRNA(Asn)/glutamyl-tRNA(Gln) amidotransferase subunit C
MQVDETAVRRMARLARIKVTDSEATALTAELSAILGWIRQLDEVDTREVEPMSRVVAMTVKMRDDEVTEGDDRAAILANAPMHERGFFVVPKIVE